MCDKCKRPMIDHGVSEARQCVSGDLSKDQIDKWYETILEQVIFEQELHDRR